MTELFEEEAAGQRSQCLRNKEVPAREDICMWDIFSDWSHTVLGIKAEHERMCSLSQLFVLLDHSEHPVGSRKSWVEEAFNKYLAVST